MRLALLASVAIILPIQAQAATFIIKDTIDPVNGFVSINNWGSQGPLPTPVGYMADNSKMKVSLSINHGVIAEVDSYIPVSYAYDDYSFYEGLHVNSGEDYRLDESCGYNGGGSDGCFFAPPGNPGEPLTPARLTSGFKVGTKSLSYTIFRPHSYDFCTNQSVGICSESWSLENEYNFTIFSHQPVSYTLKFQSLGNNAAVPETASWALMIAGFGLAGGTLRRQRKYTRQGAVSFA